MVTDRTITKKFFGVNTSQCPYILCFDINKLYGVAVTLKMTVRELMITYLEMSLKKLQTVHLLLLGNFEGLEFWRSSSYTFLRRS